MCWGYVGGHHGILVSGCNMVVGGIGLRDVVSDVSNAFMFIL